MTYAETCTTGDCDNPVHPNGFIRLGECDCAGDPDLFPNCNGHNYCKECTGNLVWGGEFAGCIWCSTGPSLVSHVGDMKVCDHCDQITALQCVLDEMVRAWKAYDDEDDEKSRRWEDDMNAAIKRALELLP